MKKNIVLYAVICMLLFKNCTTVTTSAPAGSTGCSYNGISRDELVEMIRTYKNGQLEHINTGMRKGIDSINQYNRAYDQEHPSRFEDARTIFFKLDTLEQFFNAVKCKVAEKALTTQKGTPIKASDIGVRIYYTAYPGLEGKPEKPVNEETKKGHHTLVFVATYFDEVTGKNVDFDPDDYTASGPANSNVPRPLDDPAFSGSKKRYFALFTGPSEVSDDAGRNHGELCPPPKGCGTVLTNLADALPTSER